MSEFLGGEAGQSVLTAAGLYVDQTGALTAEDVDRLPEAAFLAAQDIARPINFGAAPHWFVLRIRNSAARETTRILEVLMPYLDYVDVYTFRGLEQRDHFEAGDRRPAERRILFHRNFAFPITLGADDVTKVLVRVQTSSRITVDMRLWWPSAFFAASQQNAVELGLWHGANLFGIAFIALATMIVPSRVQAWYFLHLLNAEIYFACIQGFISALVFPSLPLLGDAFTSASILVLPITGFAFLRSGLDLAARRRWLDLTVKGLIAACATLISGAALWGYGAVAAIANGLLALYILMGFVLSIEWAVRRVPISPLVLAGMVLIFLSASVQMARSIYPTIAGLVPDSVGLAISVFSAIALATNHLASFKRAMTQRRDVQQQLLDRARAEGKTLALEVQRRTAEIASSHGLLAQARDRERRIANEQRAFLSMVSHEFRSPLNGIALAADVLAQHVPHTDTYSHQELWAIRTSVAHLSGLTNAFLGEAWLESSALSPRAEAVDLADLVAAAVPPEAVDRVRLAIDSRADMVGDSTLLQVAFTNLIENALKYSGPDAPVRVSLQRRGATATVRVEDQGPGISEADLPRVFDRYFRSEAHRNLPGAGLGLSITREIVAAHGGTISVQNSAGGGCAFRIDLPIATIAT